MSYDEKTNSSSLVPTNIKSIKLILNNVSVTINTGNIPSLSFENCTQHFFEYDFVDGTWILKEKKNLNFSHFPHSKFPVVHITLADNVVLEKVDISLGYGCLHAQNINSKFVAISTKGGAIKFKNLVSDETSIDCIAGQIALSGKLTGKTEVHCNMGNVTIKNNLKEKYMYLLHVGMGTIHIDGRCYTNIKYASTHGNYSNSYDLHCKMGNISIK